MYQVLMKKEDGQPRVFKSASEDQVSGRCLSQLNFFVVDQNCLWHISHLILTSSVLQKCAEQYQLSLDT